MGEARVKYLTKDDIIEINRAAIRENRNRQLNEDFIESLPEDKFYTIVYIMYHNKDEIRVEILFDEKWKTGYVDMSQYRYDMIPTAIVYDDGRVEFEEPEIMESKRPYPKGREWSEKVIKAPVRKQNKFRKEVLRAYEDQCAVCNIKGKQLVRAAHIIPVVEDSDDSVNNGICLCHNHEIAFDRDILKIDPNGDIFVCCDEDIKVDFSKIRFPKDKNDYPSYEKLKIRFNKYKNM